MIGKTLGHYRILSHLGSGAMGDVYLAEDERLHRKIAIKVLPPAASSRPERLARFRREAESVAALSHPNTVTIFSVEEVDGIHFLTMELVDGETLDASIREGGLPLERILELAVPMADALAAVHEAGVIHRDLKPANIMIDRRGHVRVMDFGLARMDPQLALDQEDVSEAPTRAHEVATRDAVLVGTVPYMAPEQVQGKRVDHRADLFALGVVMYELATGRRPFAGESGPDVMSAILRDDPRPLVVQRPDLPRSFRWIVERCLAKDPDKRFQSAGELRDALKAIRADAHEEGGPPQRR